MRLVLTTSPAEEPISLDEAKIHLRVDHADEDAYITALITAARGYAEQTTGRPFITQSWAAYADGFCSVMELKANLQAVSEIRYTDTDGAQQVLAASVYKADPHSVIGSVRLDYNQSWPSSRGDRNNVEIDFTCGYGDAAAVPPEIKQAMLLIIGNLYENRESTVIGVSASDLPMGVDMLLSMHSMVRIG